MLRTLAAPCGGSCEARGLVALRRRPKENCLKPSECDIAAPFFRAQVAKAVAEELQVHAGLRAWRIVDIGCGHGFWLQHFQQWTHEPGRLFGLDCDWQRVQSAKKRVQTANIVLGDARDLPWQDGVFDLVTQFVVFTSVLVDADRQRIAREMLRVVKPAGLILWYDFFAPNPFNNQTRPVRRHELAALFPGCRILLRKVTLAPPLARVSLRMTQGLAEVLDRVSALRTHYLAFISREGAS